MEFDLIELLKYIGIGGREALFLLSIVFFLWLIFSNKEKANKLRMRVIQTFSDSSEKLHIGRERLTEKINDDIDGVLDYLQEQTNAENVLVARFRNGTYDSMGSSILKFYASNEKAKPGYRQIGDNIQDISRSLYSNFCNTLIKEHKIFIKDKESIEEDKFELLGIMSLFGEAKRFYARSLVTTGDNQIIGFVCVVYKEPYKIAESRIDYLLTEAAARVVSKLELGKIQ